MSVQLCRRQFIIPLALLAVITPFLFFSLSPSSLGPSRSGTGLHPHYPPPHAPFDASEPWRFVPARDARGALTHAQCDSAFPRLFEPLEAIVKARKGQLIKQKDVEIPQGACMLRVLIFDNELFVIDVGDPYSCHIPRYRERIMGYLGGIYKAITTSREPVSNIEFALTYADMVNPKKSSTDAWIVTRRVDDEITGHLWLMPDYGYWAWGSASLPSYDSARRRISEVSMKHWSDKTAKAVWRGNKNMSPLRTKLFEVAEGKKWSDIKHVTPDELKHGTGNYLTVEGLCEYKFLVQTEGSSYSGRLKYLQLCNSVTVAHKLEWAEFHTHLMQPSGTEQNFIEVKRDWSDLDSSMTEALRNAEQTEQIAERSFETFNQRYLTPAAIDCYWRRLIETWASLQGFEPQLYTQKWLSKEKNARGVPFEDFIATFPNVTQVAT